MKIIRNQKGMGLISALLFIVMLLALATIGFQIVPAYITNASVKSILNEITTSPQLLTKGSTNITRASLMVYMQKQFIVNNIQNVALDNLIIQQETNGMTIDLPYEVRVHVIANIDAVMKFHHQVTIIGGV